MDSACQSIAEEKLDCVALFFSHELETRAWAAASGLKLKIALVSDTDFTRRYVDWLTAVPLVFLVDERGLIRYKHGGERSEEYDAALVRNFVERGDQ